MYEGGQKTLVGYTKPINMKRYGTTWITGTEDVWDIGGKIYDAPIISIIPTENKRYLRNATSFEREALDVQEWKEPAK
jgi:hypothetical protein